MSKTSVRSKTPSLRSISRRKRKILEENATKPFDFCCSIANFDPLTKYDQRKPPFKSSLSTIMSVHECPVLKFRMTDCDGQAVQRKKMRSTSTGDLSTRRSSRIGQGQRGQGQRGQGQRSQGLTLRFGNDNDTKNLQLTSSYSTPCFTHRGPLRWFLEDEIALAKDTFWEEKRRIYERLMEQNLAIAMKKGFLLPSFLISCITVIALLILLSIHLAQRKIRHNTRPRWYFEFSAKQLQNLLILERVMQADYEEILTERTQKALIAVGIITAEFRLKPNVIRNLQRSTKLNAVDFLREIYQLVTGKQLEDAVHKKQYESNEKILLSGIAFLTLPEAVAELHKRLPPVEMPKIPPKPIRPTIILKKVLAVGEDPIERPNLGEYRNHLRAWVNYVRETFMPKVYLPPEPRIFVTILDILSTAKGRSRNMSRFSNGSGQYERRGTEDSTKVSRKRLTKDTIEQSGKREIKDTVESSAPRRSRQSKDLSVQSGQRQSKGITVTVTQGRKSRDEDDQRKTSTVEKQEGTEEFPEFDIPRLPDESKKFSFTLTGMGEEPGPVQYKICGTLNPPKPYTKSWLGEKQANYVLSGVSEDPPECPVTYELSGVANVTPTNSDERFFAVLKLGDGDKKIYPSGRKNLSRNWQEWLQNADEEYKTVEREANKIIKSIEATMRLVFPGPTCDSCCSCRQTRKTHMKMKETKAPYLVIDTVAEDDDKHKYIVGSMAMHSPAPSPEESSVNLIEVIASEEKIMNNVVIDGVTNEQGKTKVYISGHKKNSIHIPSRIVHLPPPPPPRNVPPCACAVHQMFNKGIEPTLSSDNIPWTKDEGLCFGKKFRPNESPAYSCKQYPGDKSCRRNPFLKDVKRVLRKKELDALKAIEDAEKMKDDWVPKKKKMYSIADFHPCGDEHGMGLCGGPWGTLNLFSPAELAELERQRKEILKGPPCGEKPGRAVCEGPFGTKIPFPPKKSSKDNEYNLAEGLEEVEDEEETDEEEEEPVPQPPPPKVRPKHRGQSCFAGPEMFEATKKVVPKKTKRFIPDPNYPGYDDPWNIFRTAPSKVKKGTDYEKTLKLSAPKQPTSLELYLQGQKSGIQLAAVSSKMSRIADKSMERIIRKDKSAIMSNFDRLGKIEKIEKFDRPTKVGKSLRSVKIESLHSIKRPKRKASKQPDKADAKESKTNGKESTPIVPENKEDPEEANKPLDEPEMQVKSDKIGGKVSKKQKRQSNTVKTLPKCNGLMKWHRKRQKKPKDRIKTTDPGDEQTPVTSETEEPQEKSQTAPSNEKPSKKKSSKSKSPKPAPKIPREKRASVGSGNKEPEPKAQSVTKPRKKQKPKTLKQPESNKTSLSAEKESRSKSKSSTRKGTRKKEENRRRSVEIRRIHPLPEPKTESEEKQADKMTPERYAQEVMPAILPMDPPAKCHPPPENVPEEVSQHSSPSMEEVQVSPRGPCGWRTKSEQALATKKTVVYLAESAFPPEEVPVRPGGRPCLCRENRNKKKVLKYNIEGFTDKKKIEGKQLSKLFKKGEDEGNEQRRVLDGVTYYTPPPSPRRSEEYVPEYDVIKSPYDMCLKDRKDTFLKLLEKYTLPTGKTPKALRVQTCGCNDYMDTYGIVGLNQADQGVVALPVDEQSVDFKPSMTFDKLREEMIRAQSPKERWSIALKDVALIDYFTRCQDNVPCWLKCTKYDRAGCPINPPKLVIKKPVCECKYERKIVEQKDEERHWKERQQRLKTYKKKTLKNIVDISRPLVPDTKLMISGVQRIPREDEYIDDIKYEITGVSENYRMAEPEPIVSVNLVTPDVTPAPSVKEIPCMCLHRHWSETDLPPGPLRLQEDIEKEELQKRKEAVDEAFRQIYNPPESDLNLNVGYVSCQGSCEPPPVVTKTKKKRKGEKSAEDKSEGRVREITVEKEVKEVKDGKPQKKREKVETERRSFGRRNDERTDNKIEEKSVSADKRAGKKSRDGQDRRKSKDEHVEDVDRKDTVEGEEDNIKPQDFEVTFSDSEIREFKKHPVKVMRRVLKQMAEEGFLFANLPKSYLMPELNLWLMYRLGDESLHEDKKQSLETLLGIWNMLCALRQPISVTLDFVRQLLIRNQKFACTCEFYFFQIKFSTSSH